MGIPRFKFLLDYAFLVLPPLLTMTTLSDSLLLLSCVLTACLFTLLVFICCEYFVSPDRPTVKVVLNRIVENSTALLLSSHKPELPLTLTLRSSMLLSVPAAILAVDFPVFPRRHIKTEKYGHSLMDVGVASFIFASALASRVKSMSSWEASTRRKGWNRWLRSSYVILPLIGVVRTAILKFLDYPQHETEYGVHWNFFYTLAVVKIVSMALPKRYSLFWACTFGVLQQTMLIQGYERCIEQVGDPEWIDDIEKDLNRQFPNHKMFSRYGKYGDGGKDDLFQLHWHGQSSIPRKAIVRGRPP